MGRSKGFNWNVYNVMVSREYLEVIKKAWEEGRGMVVFPGEGDPKRLRAEIKKALNSASKIDADPRLAIMYPPPDAEPGDYLGPWRDRRAMGYGWLQGTIRFRIMEVSGEDVLVCTKKEET